MGREAYLARLALGQSAFQEPLKDEHGEFVLGGQAHRYDDISYCQQWDGRGHPRNPASEQNAKKFYKSQNEILQACGLVVRKDAEKKRKRRRHELPESSQLSIVESENEIGFVLKYVDNLAGDLLTWWICNVKKRLLVFQSPRSTLLDTLRAGTNSSATISLLFGGFAASTIEGLLATTQTSDLEGTRYIDFLEMRVSRSPPSRQERARKWAKWVLLESIELPLDMLAGLQNLGFTVGPALVTHFEHHNPNQTALSSILSATIATSTFAGLTLLYLLRRRLQDEIFWRFYALLRQILPRPCTPTQISLKAAQNDEFDESEDMLGIGRSLGSNTNRRFFGPQSFWPALRIAFPWVKLFTKDPINRESIKYETLARCAILEAGNPGPYDLGNRTIEDLRALNIISNLESLGINIEEDFYVDMDQWLQELDAIEVERISDDEELGSDVVDLGVVNRFDGPATNAPLTENTPGQSGLSDEPSAPGNHDLTAILDHGIAGRIQSVRIDDSVRSPNVRMAPVEVLSFPTSPQNEASVVSGTPAAHPEANLLSLSMEIENMFGQTSFDSQPVEPVPEQRVLGANDSHDQNTPPGTAPEWGQPLTPEPGIRRARSLSHTQTTPRPVRRSTETGDENDVEADMTEVLAEARLQNRKKVRSDQESRVTRVSVFASDSLAWHASSMITSIVLLPLNAVCYRRLATWFLSITENLNTDISIFPREEMQLVGSPFTLSQGRMVLLSVGIECVIHGLLWRVGCGVARYYGRMYHWGKF